MVTKTCYTFRTIDPKLFSSLLDHATQMLGLTSDEIKAKFHEYPVSINRVFDDFGETNLIEIHFEKENGLTRGTFLKEENNCDYVSINFLTLVDPDEYIAFLNSHYSYNYLKQCWNLPTCKACVSKSMEGIRIELYKSK